MSLSLRSSRCPACLTFNKRKIAISHLKTSRLKSIHTRQQKFLQLRKPTAHSSKSSSTQSLPTTQSPMAICLLSRKSWRDLTKPTSYPSSRSRQPLTSHSRSHSSCRSSQARETSLLRKVSWVSRQRRNQKRMRLTCLVPQES